MALAMLGKHWFKKRERKEKLVMYRRNYMVHVCNVVFFSFLRGGKKEEDLYFSVTFPDCKAITENRRRPHKYANHQEITGFNGSAFK